MSDQYVNPLTDRYASAEMSAIFSPARKFGTWRRLWLALAESQAELGLPVPDEAGRLDVALAETACIAEQRRAEFEALLQLALRIDTRQPTAERLANLVAQRRARWLLARTDHLFSE